MDNGHQTLDNHMSTVCLGELKKPLDHIYILFSETPGLLSTEKSICYCMLLTDQTKLGNHFILFDVYGLMPSEINCILITKLVQVSHWEGIYFRLRKNLKGHTLQLTDDILHNYFIQAHSLQTENIRKLKKNIIMF